MVEFWCSCLLLHSFKITFSCFVFPSMVRRCISCRIISSQPFLDMPPQQGVASDLLRPPESRGSLQIRLWPQGLVSRQATAMRPVCGFDIRSVALQEAEVNSRRNHLLIIWDAELLGPCFATAHKCQETKEDVFHQLAPKYCKIHGGRHH